MIAWWWECQVQWSAYWVLWLKSLVPLWKWQKTSPLRLLLQWQEVQGPPGSLGDHERVHSYFCYTLCSIRDTDSYNSHQFKMQRASWRTMPGLIVLPKQWPFSTLKLTVWHSERLAAITRKPHKQKRIQSIGNRSTSHLGWDVLSGPGEGPEAERQRYRRGAMVGGCQLLSFYPWPWGHSESRVGWGSQGLCHTYSCIVWCARDFMLQIPIIAIDHY